MDQRYIESTLELIDFIQDSPSCFHVVANASTMLENAGATRLDEKESLTYSKFKVTECVHKTSSSSSVCL